MSSLFGIVAKKVHEQGLTETLVNKVLRSDVLISIGDQQMEAAMKREPVSPSFQLQELAKVASPLIIERFLVKQPYASSFMRIIDGAVEGNNVRLMKYMIKRYLREAVDRYLWKLHDSHAIWEECILPYFDSKGIKYQMITNVNQNVATYVCIIEEGIYTNLRHTSYIIHQDSDTIRLARGLDVPVTITESTLMVAPGIGGNKDVVNRFREHANRRQMMELLVGLSLSNNVSLFSEVWEANPELHESPVVVYDNDDFREPGMGDDEEDRIPFKQSIFNYATKAGGCDIMHYMINLTPRPSVSHMDSAILSQDLGVVKWCVETARLLGDPIDKTFYKTFYTTQEIDIVDNQEIFFYLHKEVGLVVVESLRNLSMRERDFFSRHPEILYNRDNELPQYPIEELIDDDDIEEYKKYVVNHGIESEDVEAAVSEKALRILDYMMKTIPISDEIIIETVTEMTDIPLLRFMLPHVNRETFIPLFISQMNNRPSAIIRDVIDFFQLTVNDMPQDVLEKFNEAMSIDTTIPED